MNIKTKIFIIAFLTGGLLFSLVYWAMDDTEGEGFSLTKFIGRFIIFGLGMALSHIIAWQVDQKISKKKNDQNDSKK